ncbi:DUF853 family protein [Mediterraneibacter glycyrrhizinilyticus]|uniref:ATP-binding protein n=1 Tax=Mediterraneibacter glycyrrhizinilyticus TaxID=342942 RepID=UPI0025AA9145|nr:helicase HerA-like domain-containing protein [Mediterraneibacter glycyrrhizinilyticus]MDN0062617.1 DUF853 family protein [Mediterraneibacter glycyrrhizinilyticus]
MSSVSRDILMKDLFKGIELDRLKIENDIKVPNEFYQNLLDYFMERSYLNRLSERERFSTDMSNTGKITWLRITRLPVHPDHMEDYELLSRWQGVLASMHAWGHRTIFLLNRCGGETRIYLGTASSEKGVRSSDAVEQMRESASGNMPGIELQALSPEEILDQISGGLSTYQAAGAVTGIPSFRNSRKAGMLQTLDQLSFGIRDLNGNEKDYALLVIADPLKDGDVAELIGKMRRLSSEIHLDVSRTVSETESQSENKNKGAAAGSGGGLLGALIGSCIGGGAAQIGSILGRGLAAGIGGLTGIQKQIGMSYSKNVTTQYLDRFAQYAEQLLEQHIERLKKGRNLGFWNTGVYVLGNTKKDIRTVTGMLRSVYSGDETYLEPIRLHTFKDGSGALETVKYGMELVPLTAEEEAEQGKEWHIFGKVFQYVSTPMNTEELSLAASLPRRDVPGLRFVKTAVRFANNPAEFAGDSITLGRVVDTGVIQNNEYKIDPHALVRHALVTGSTGSGKSTTCKTIIREVSERGIPVLIIEPAKDDYMRWAVQENRKLPEDRRFQLYMPGVKEFEGEKLSELKLNPFQPGAVGDAPVDLMQRGEKLTAVLNASLPVSDVLPVIIDETVYSYLYRSFKAPFLAGEMEQPLVYPKMDGMIEMAKDVLRARNYEQKVQDNIGASLETRFQYLVRGTRGKILNVSRSTEFDELFRKPAVINLSRITNEKDRALIMSLLMISLYEYRISAYTWDENWRREAQKNHLLHLTVIEEAHNVLARPRGDYGGTGNPQQAAADLFVSMLSEIRSYGEGMMIVDQVPTRLIPDAVKNTNYKIVHRLTSPDDCDVMAAGLALRPDQKSLIVSLVIGNAVICGDMDDAAAWVKINKLE